MCRLGLVIRKLVEHYRISRREELIVQHFSVSDQSLPHKLQADSELVLKHCLIEEDSNLVDILCINMAAGWVSPTEFCQQEQRVTDGLAIMCPSINMFETFRHCFQHFFYTCQYWLNLLFPWM